MSKINDWTYKWKISFNTDSTKPALKLSSVEKYNNIHYPLITFNKPPVKRVQSHNHLGLTLKFSHSKLNFNEHSSSILSIVKKLTAVLRKLQTVLPRPSLLTIHKAL